MFHDEVRSISRTFGTPAQIVTWQPPDWPPLYYLVLGAYRVITGFHPLVIRYSSVLLFALSLAAMYQAGQRLFHSPTAGALSTAAYATLGMSLYQSTNVRGYVLALALYALAYWLTLRYFDTPRPRWRRALPLAIALAALFYTTYTVALGYVLLIAFTLLAYPLARNWRWWRPGVIAAGLALPQIWRLGSYILPILYQRETARAADAVAIPANNTFLGYLWRVLRSYAGGAWLVWLALAGVFVAVLLIRRRTVPRRVWALIALAAAGPLIAATLGRFVGMVGPHYSWWAVFPLAWLAGWSLDQLPRPVSYGALVVLVLVPFYPINLEGYSYGNEFQTPMESNFAWLTQNIEPGDVLYIDESCDAYEQCGTAEEWDYYQMVYFPDRRLRIADTLAETTEARRVWYVHINGWHNKDVQNTLAEGRVQSEFVGPWNFLFQLYEAPPNPDGIAYENGLRFHGADVIDARLKDGYAAGPVVRREAETVRLRLWWSVDEPVARDYSLSTLIAGSPDAPPLAQVDGPPQTVSLFPGDPAPPANTSTWEPGRYYVEERVIQLPPDISTDYRDRPIGIYLTVYQWWDGQPVAAPGVNDLGRRQLRTMNILAY